VATMQMSAMTECTKNQMASLPRSPRDLPGEISKSSDAMSEVYWEGGYT